MVQNPALDCMRGGGTALGVVLRFERGPHIARAMRSCGFDWLFIDLEHGSMPLDAVAGISVAALDAGITPLVRVPPMDLATAVRVLDTGALGVLMPHVETVDEARAIAAAFRYPPSGHRSISSTLPHFRFNPPPIAQACRALDEATLVGVMLETPSAVQRADSIAAVPGIDFLFVGAADLTAEAGLHGGTDHPQVMAMFRTVADAARKHGKLVGIGGVSDDAVLAGCCEMGMQLILLGTDLGFMMSAATARTRAVRAGIAAATGARSASTPSAGALAAPPP
jgi:4-hydroxy-2-oxoheptanedioate aldolase